MAEAYPDITVLVDWAQQTKLLLWQRLKEWFRKAAAGVWQRQQESHSVLVLSMVHGHA